MPTTHVPWQSSTFPDVPPTSATNFWLVVVSPYWMAATYGHGPIPLTLIFCQLFRWPNWRHGIPPHTFCHGHASSPISPPLPRLTFIWLLCVRHPLSPQFFDPSLYIPPNEQINDSREAAVPWFDGAAALPMEREGKLLESRVVAAWVGCCECVVCCVLLLMFYPFCRVEHLTQPIFCPILPWVTQHHAQGVCHL
jgi:hypothetical protein